MTEWLLIGAGALVVVVTLWDMFHTLWHPAGFGRIARGVFDLVWWTVKRGRPRRLRRFAGPFALLLTVLTWTGLVVLGWALVYLARMPEGFYFTSSLRPEESSDALAAVYLSLVTVATAGFGDITPADPLLRLLTPFEALMGFVLLTAAISWILQVYPALGRRRSVAKRLSLLRSSDAASVVVVAEASVASRMLDAVADGVIQVETDLVQYTESYYFVEEDREMSLALALPYALTMAGAGHRSAHPEVRHAAVVLTAAVESLADRLDRQYLATGSTVTDVLDSYAADHGCVPLRAAHGG